MVFLRGLKQAFPESSYQSRLPDYLTILKLKVNVSKCSLFVFLASAAAAAFLLGLCVVTLEHH